MALSGRCRCCRSTSAFDPKQTLFDVASRPTEVRVASILSHPPDQMACCSLTQGHSSSSARGGIHSNQEGWCQDIVPKDVARIAGREIVLGEHRSDMSERGTEHED